MVCDHPTSVLVPYVHALSAAALALHASRSDGAVSAVRFAFGSVFATALACLGNAYTPVAVGRHWIGEIRGDVAVEVQ
jgi:hypothetical protein